MLGPILILANLDDGAYLRQILFNFAPNIQVDIVGDTLNLLQISQTGSYQKAITPRLVSFCSNVIVAPMVLDRFKGGCYNFHPGPPESPGSHAASFAIYDRVETFGATVHEMAASVDTGAIVGVDRFPVPNEFRFLELEVLAHKNLLILFKKLAPYLVNTTQPLEHIDIQWGKQKRTRLEFKHMKQITNNMSEEEIRLRWRAFG
jgi:methionyl-tRNA formyltransferase